MSNIETIYYIKNRYFLLYKKATPKHCTQNYCVILAREQKRGLKNVLNRANVINVRFCSIIGKFELEIKRNCCKIYYKYCNIIQKFIKYICKEY